MASSLNPHHRFIFLDALRGLAATAVIFFHRKEYLAGGIFEHGYLAVDFFFMLSGFVIAFSYESKLRAGLRLSEFVTRRITRLVPLLFLGSLLGLGVEVLKGITKHDTERLVEAFAAFPFSVLSLPNFLVPSPEAFILNGVIWSLFFEIIANLVYGGIARRLGNALLLAIIAASGAGLFFVTQIHDGIEVGTNYSTLSLGLLRVTFPFFTGVLLCRYRQTLSAWMSGYVAIPLGATVAVALAVPVLAEGANYLYDFLMVAAVFPIIILAGSLVDLRKSPASGAIELAGAVSYAVYIIHVPLLNAADYPLAWLNAQPLVRFTIYLAVVMPAAYLATAYFDQPVQEWLKRRKATCAQASQSAFPANGR